MKIAMEEMAMSEKSLPPPEAHWTVEESSCRTSTGVTRRSRCARLEQPRGPQAMMPEDVPRVRGENGVIRWDSGARSRRQQLRSPQVATTGETNEESQIQEHNVKRERDKDSSAGELQLHSPSVTKKDIKSKEQVRQRRCRCP